MAEDKAESRTLRVPSFDGVHCDHWSKLMENLLRSKNLWALIETGIGRVGNPMNGAERTQVEEIKMKDCKVKNYLYKPLIGIWDSLKKKFEGNEKIFKTPSHRSTKNNTASPVIQILTMQSCNTASTECATDALSEDSTSKNGKFEVIKREASCLLDIEELSLINNNILSHNPPTELFDKLSLQGDSELITVSGIKENIQG